VEQDPQLVEALRRLAAGEFEPDEWLRWWEAHAERVAGLLNRGQWLRLKPPLPGGFGPPSRCAAASQPEAVRLLGGWGIEHEHSDRYERDWQAEFARATAEQEQEQMRRRSEYRPRLDCLKGHFPKLARFLGRHLDQVEELAGPATTEQIEELERALGVSLPESYRRFLRCTQALVYGDGLHIGLPGTFQHPDEPGLPSAGRICFGDYWLEGDGDQVLFGEGESGREPPVLYYNHAEPSVRRLAEDFPAWLESLARTLND
jgi:hypothetical protein